MQEEEDDRLKSSFYDELFALNLDKLSWYPMQVKSVQAAAARAAAEQAAPDPEAPGAAETDQEEAKEEEEQEQVEELSAAQLQAEREEKMLAALGAAMSGLWRAVGDLGDGAETEEYFLLCAGGATGGRIVLRGCARSGDEVFSIRGGVEVPLADEAAPSQLSFEQTYDEDPNAPPTRWAGRPGSC